MSIIHKIVIYLFSLPLHIIHLRIVIGTHLVLVEAEKNIKDVV
uniref:Uncharacterized protein n=1 Tax=Siphoviridae sp. ctMgQ24 TaxID=2826263 RepID=A0A8S5QQH3_9CAUD|nr:MAG TPA: hypothetical protein [Siphoviridae sp. ctMgQ24]